MKQQDIERIKDLCAKEGFDLIKQDGRYYIQQARNRVIWFELQCYNERNYIHFIVSNQNEIKHLKEELEQFLVQQLEKFLNNELSSKVITYPPHNTSTT